MNTLVEYRVLDRLKVINEGTADKKKLKVKGRFQKCDEQNNNGRIYPRPILEAQVAAIQEKITERSLVGALDHPPNDGILLSQASHLITKLYIEPNGDVMGEAEILSTPSGKIVEALLSDGVKIGISSRGLGTLSETKNGKVVNEDYKLLTFDLVSDPSTKGAYPEITEAIKLNSIKAQGIVSKMKNERILLTALSQKINERLSEKRKNSDDGYDAARDRKATGDGVPYKSFKGKPDTSPPQKNPNFKPTSTLQKNLVKELDKANKPKGKKSNFAENAIIKQLTSLMRAKLSEGGNPINKAKKKDFEAAHGNKLRTTKTPSEYVDHSNAANRAKQTLHTLAGKIDQGKVRKGSAKGATDRAYSRQVRKNDGGYTKYQTESEVLESLQRLQEGKSTSKDKACVKNYLLSRLSDIYEPYEPTPATIKPETEAQRSNKKLQWLKRLLAVIEEI
jgi:hypothetical protein